MKVLVSGATGFVGTALMQRLFDDSGMQPIAMVRQGRGSLSHDIDVLEAGPMEACDVQAADLRGIDVAVHLAARAHVLDESDAQSLAVFRRVNVAGTLHLARQAAEAGVRRFVFVSSIGVLGRQGERPFLVSDPPNPQEPYAVSKREAEQGLAILGNETGMEMTVIRPPLVYGPGAPGNFGRLQRLVASGLPLPLGAIANKRSFVGLDNLVDLLVRCLDHPAAPGQTFLVADGQDLSTPELVRLMAEAMGRPPRLVPVPVSLLRLAGRLTGKGAEVERLCGSLRVDDSETRRVLDWAPPVSVEEGVRRMVEGRVSARRPAPSARNAGK